MVEIGNSTCRTEMALPQPHPGPRVSRTPCPARGTHQGVEGGHGEDAQAAHGHLGGAAGEGQQPLGVGQLPALQAGQVTAVPEQVHLELLQVLLPHEDLGQGAAARGEKGEKRLVNALKRSQ